MINEAIKIANRSPFLKHRTGAIIVVRDEIVANGWSHIPGRRLNTLFSLHAELHALARSRHLNLRDKSAECFVVTITKGNNVVNAQPCLQCAIALRAAGVECVTYSLTDSRLAYLDIEDLLNDYDLKVYRAP